MKRIEKIIKSSICFILLLVFGLLFMQCEVDKEKIIYVGVDGSDSNMGTKSRPVKSLNHAIRLAKENQIKNIVFRSGRHQLDSTVKISFEERDSLIIAGEDGAILSGGVEIKDFVRIDGNLYRANVSHLLKEEFTNYRQLFRGDKRLPRAQTPNGEDYFLTTGQVEQYRDKVNPWNFKENALRQKENPEIHTGFAYNAGDIKSEWNEPYVELLMHHSWESSWHTIRKIDTAKNELFMNTPSVWPVNFFGSHGDKLRYKLFNHKSFIDQAGEWMIDPEDGWLYYLAEPDEDVSESTFILAVVSKLLEIDQSTDITFKNVTFAHSDYKMGIYSPGVHAWEDTIYSPSWSEYAQRLYFYWPKKFYPGYSEPQAAVHSGEAITISASSNVKFINCKFIQMGANAIWIREGSSQIQVANCLFDDLGAGAVKIGVPKNDIKYWNLKEEDMPHDNIISNSVIKNGGNVFTGCVGIWIAQSYDNIIKGNEIFNYPYTGISLGWNWNTEPNHTKRNQILNNRIHDVLQVLTDGGGIYTLGLLEGCIISGNEIYNIYRSENAAGSNSNGIFFDEGTEALTVTKNYIHDILNAPIRFNSTFHERLKTIENNYFDVEYIPVKRNNNYNMDYDESGFMHLIIEGNNYGVKDSIEWKKEFN